MLSVLGRNWRHEGGPNGWIGSVLLGLVVLLSSATGHVTEKVQIAGRELTHVKYEDDGWNFPRGRAFRLDETGFRLEGERPELSADERIIQGEKVGDSGLFPEVVMLAAPSSSKPDVLLLVCTGTLVDEKVVLTAAHCTITFDDTNSKASGEGPLFVCAGSTDYTKPGGQVCARAVDGYINDDYRSSLFSGQDIALLGLESSLLVDGVQIGRVNLDEPGYGTLVYAVGFGIHTHAEDIAVRGRMRFTDGLLVPSDRCRALGALLEPHSFDPDLVCFDGHYDGSGANVCNGDSGGPLMVLGEMPEENFVLGVVSWGLSVDVVCGPLYESVYASLYSDNHREFLITAMEKLGGSWITVTDAPELNCEGRMKLCMARPGDKSCLNEDDSDLESCCPESISEIRCLKAVADDCRDYELMTGLDKLLETYDAKCAPKYLCGADDVERCTADLAFLCELNFLQGDPRFNSLDCCEAKVRAVTCLEKLGEKCTGNELVATALQEIEEEFASAELCEEFECSQDRIEYCTPVLFFFFFCDQNLSGPTSDMVSRAACCDIVYQTIDCLSSAERKCPNKKEFREARESAQITADSAQCFRDEPEQSCDPAQCSSQFWTYCGEDPLELDYYYTYYLYYYPTGTMGDLGLRQDVLCCYQASHAKSCLAYQKERCGEEYVDILESEEKRVEAAIDLEQCEMTRCDPEQCDLIPFEEGESPIGLPDNRCSELGLEKLCLKNVLGRCEDGDMEGTLAKRLEETEEMEVEKECNSTDCTSRALFCYDPFAFEFTCSTVADFKFEKAGQGQRCCAYAQRATNCLQTAAEECAEDPTVVKFLKDLEESYPAGECEDIICTPSLCSGQVEEQCERVDDSTDLMQRDLCCEQLKKKRNCLQGSLSYECSETGIELLEAELKSVQNKFVEDECQKVSCARGVAECSVGLNKLGCNDGVFGNECCRSARVAKDCLSFLRIACGLLPEVVEDINAKLERLDRNILQPHCDACYGLCGEGTDCVVTGNGQAFCADCTAMVKPHSNGTDAECCEYNPDNKKCQSVLKNKKPGICIKSDELFYTDEDGVRQQATGLTRTSYCRDLRAMRKLGLACKVVKNDADEPECI